MGRGVSLFYQLVGSFSYEEDHHLGFFSSEEKARKALDSINPREFLDNYIIWECRVDAEDSDPYKGRKCLRSFYVSLDTRILVEETVKGE